MIFSKATGYGIRALAYLANQAGRGPRGIREIAGSQQIPPVYLRKVLGELRRHRLLRSTKGIYGGYELAWSPDAITLWDVFQLLEPDPDLDLCILGRGLCTPESACPLHDDWQQVRQELVKLLQNRTISKVAAMTAANESGCVSKLPEKRETELFLCPKTDFSEDS